MRFDEIAIIAVRGIGLGSVYALVAMSFNIVKVSSGILNFAQGNMVVLGGLLAYFLFAMAGGPTPLFWASPAKTRFQPSKPALLLPQGAASAEPPMSPKNAASAAAQRKCLSIMEISAFPLTAVEAGLLG